MTAQEAKQKSILGQTEIFGRAIKNIERAANEGSMGITFWTYLKDEVNDKNPVNEIKQKLIKLGYEVTESWSTANTEYKLLINW